MSCTPSNSRMMSPTFGSLRLTPSNSPFAKATAVRSPVKAARTDLTLSLKQVIGTTTDSSNAFDSLPHSKSFAFTAGAAAVVVTIGENHHVSQKFFRARPTAQPLNLATSLYEPSTPTNGVTASRNRVAASLRQSGYGVSNFGSPAADWSDSPASKPWAAKERVKAATCVSFSSDEKYLAVGETGYKPRVLIFSTSADASCDIPLTALSDHAFGVRCVAFSPDSQYLASLGTPNDGFLYIWSISQKTGAAILHASNKCTSTISQIAWLGSNLITVGVRHVKLWRTGEQPNPSPIKSSRQSDVADLLLTKSNKSLTGRNCLLGQLLESTFTCVVAVASDKAVICSDKGDICLLDDSDGSQRFAKVAEAGFAVTTATLGSDGQLYLAGANGAFSSLKIAELLQSSMTAGITTVFSQAPHGLMEDSANVVAMVAIEDALVTCDSSHAVRVLALAGSSGISSPACSGLQLPAHGGPIYGVKALEGLNDLCATFYTWSANGIVHFWSSDGLGKLMLDVGLDQTDSDDHNELKTVHVSRDAQFLVSGDKSGVLSILGIGQKSRTFQTRAHASEITDVVIHEGDATLVASSGRDRMVQVFQKKGNTVDLLQTLDEHVGAVTRVLFSPTADRLISCSSDRTVVVRERMTSEDEASGPSTAYSILRTITLKATPVSLSLEHHSDHHLLISTIDRYVHRYDLRTGHSVSSFKATDSEGGDAVVINGIVPLQSPRGASMLASISSTDKSLRLYDDGGSLIGRDWGHTEGLTDVALLPSIDGIDSSDKANIVTVAVDGTIFLWCIDFSPPAPYHELTKSMDLAMETPSKELMTNKLPLRKVLSQSELARYSSPRSPDDDATPTGNRSPRMRKRVSKFSLAQAPKLDPSPLIRAQPADKENRRFNRNRSPSPPSPKTTAPGPKGSRRPSLDLRGRTKSTGNVNNEFGSLHSSSESVCRTLRAYRKKLLNSSDTLTVGIARELEKELALTARVVGEKAMKSKGVDETVMVKLLDQYSERLIDALSERIEATIERSARHNSEPGITSSTEKVNELGKKQEAEEIQDADDTNGGAEAAGVT